MVASKEVNPYKLTKWSETSDTSLVAQALPAVVDLDVTRRKYHTVHALVVRVLDVVRSSGSTAEK